MLKNKKILIIVAAVALVLLVVILTVLKINSSDSTRKATSTNGRTESRPLIDKKELKTHQKPDVFSE